MIADFTQNCIYRLHESQRMIHKALEGLSDEEIWQAPNPNINAIGNQLLHLMGNMRQYAISSLGNLPDHRHRDAEFEPKQAISLETLLARFNGTIAEIEEIIAKVPSDNWLIIKSVQGFQLSGIGVLLHAVEHLSYHTGQIALLVKLLKNKPLGFYDGHDLNQ
jgi:uncharacterized damage-inducible protein DinB